MEWRNTFRLRCNWAVLWMGGPVGGLKTGFAEFPVFSVLRTVWTTVFLLNVGLWFILRALPASAFTRTSLVGSGVLRQVESCLYSDWNAKGAVVLISHFLLFSLLWSHAHPRLPGTFLLSPFLFLIVRPSRLSLIPSLFSDHTNRQVASSYLFWTLLPRDCHELCLGRSVSLMLGLSEGFVANEGELFVATLLL